MKITHTIQKTIPAILCAVMLLTTACPALAETTDTDTAAAPQTTTEQTTTTQNKSEVKKGWVKQKDGTHYYREGKSVTGWQKIQGKYYFFKKGVLQVNCIAGNKSGGYYYVGEDGVRVNDKVMNMAVKVIRKNTKTEDSQSVKLRKAFLAFRKYHYQTMEAATPSKTSIRKYAEYMFTRKRGNCYRFASVMTYAAKALGYEVRFVAGNVFSRGNHHGWCEIKSKGKWQMIDVSLQRKTKKSLYRISKKDYPYWAIRVYLYPMTAKNGVITFKKIAA